MKRIRACVRLQEKVVVSEAAWWVVEVAVPALGVLSGVALLAAAAVALLLGAPRDAQVGLFAWGLVAWGGGIGWGLLVNDGVPGLRAP